MRPEGSAAVLEVRRRLAIRMLKAGQLPGVVANLVGVHRGTLWRWRRAVEQAGETAVSARPHLGARPRLCLEQRAQLAELLTQDPIEHGWPTSLWTGRRVAELIRRHFVVRYHPVYVLRLLRARGLSPQQPQRYARERDEAAIARWRRYRWPALKKRPVGSAVGRCF
jgi:transposase